VAQCAGHRLYAQWQRAQYGLCRSRERPCRGRALDRQQCRRRLSQTADRGGGGEELERSRIRPPATSAGGPAPRLLLRCAPLTHSNTCYPSSVILGLGVSPMRRREFIALFGSSVAGWPLAARAQQPERMRHIGVLMPQAESDPEQRSWTTAFATRLRELGWRQGENAQIDYRWLGGDTT